MTFFLLLSKLFFFAFKSLFLAWYAFIFEVEISVLLGFFLGICNGLSAMIGKSTFCTKEPSIIGQCIKGQFNSLGSSSLMSSLMSNSSCTLVMDSTLSIISPVIIGGSGTSSLISNSSGGSLISKSSVGCSSSLVEPLLNLILITILPAKD